VAIAADIGSREDRERLVGETLAALGRIDALVNNAGIAPRVRADITEASEESFEEVLRTNLQGPYFLTQRVARHWLEKRYPAALPGGFKIVYVTSISPRRRPSTAATTASRRRGSRWPPSCGRRASPPRAYRCWSFARHHGH